MKYLGFVCALLTCLASGCSTGQRTSRATDYSVTDAQAHPVPTASPSQRPGMNPADPRDAQFNNHTAPTEQTPVTKP